MIRINLLGGERQKARKAFVIDQGVQLTVVEGRRSVQPDLLLGREQELDPSVRTVLGEHPANCLEHDRDRRLVVGAEDRPRSVADDAVLEHRLDRPLRGHRVEMGTEENRCPRLGRGLDPGVEVARVGPDSWPGVVFGNLEAYVTQVRRNPVGDHALLTGWAGENSELREERDDLVVGHSAILGRETRYAVMATGAA